MDDTFATIEQLDEPLSVSSRLMFVHDGFEYLVSPELLANLLKTEYNMTENVAGSNPVRLVITSGQTSFTPTIDYQRGYVSYFVRLTSALTVNLPIVSSAQANADIGFFFDARQDGTGGRNITFSNVTDWYNVDPYNTANPAELQIGKTPNSFSFFSFRLVNGFWFGQYGKPV